jgi:hypothetical protein
MSKNYNKKDIRRKIFIILLQTIFSIVMLIYLNVLLDYFC